MRRAIRKSKELQKAYEEIIEKYGSKVPPLSERERLHRLHQELDKEPFYRYVLRPLGIARVILAYAPETIRYKINEWRNKK